MEGKYVNEQNWQKFRNLFLILAFVGAAVAIVGIMLLVSAFAIDIPEMGEPGWFDAESKKSGLMFGGITALMFGGVMTIAGLVMYFKRQISGAMVQGVMPVATETINIGAEKISPAIQTVVKSFNSAKTDSSNIEAALANAKSLKDRNVITEAEYQEMRKNILNIK